MATAMDPGSHEPTNSQEQGFWFMRRHNHGAFSITAEFDEFVVRGLHSLPGVRFVYLTILSSVASVSSVTTSVPVLSSSVFAHTPY
jgi:hypothetical protein